VRIETIFSKPVIPAVPGSTRASARMRIETLGGWLFDITHPGLK